MPTPSTGIEIALIDDYDVVLAGLARMLEPYRDRVRVAEIDANAPLNTPVDVALYDSFAQFDPHGDDIAALAANPLASRVVVYTWSFDPELIAQARKRGASGYLSKTLTARDLVTALEAVHGGEIVISDPPSRARPGHARDWPGRHEGLTDRESEILALITQGKTNAEIAAAAYLSPNTVKSYIRTAYRKIGVASRTQAVLWGVQNGFTPDHRRIEMWQGGGSRDGAVVVHDVEV